MNTFTVVTYNYYIWFNETKQLIKYFTESGHGFLVMTLFIFLHCKNKSQKVKLVENSRKIFLLLRTDSLFPAGLLGANKDRISQAVNGEIHFLLYNILGFILIEAEVGLVEAYLLKQKWLWKEELWIGLHYFYIFSSVFTAQYTYILLISLSQGALQ